MSMIFQEEVGKLLKMSLHHSDESGFDLNISNEYGYSKIGERLTVPRLREKSQRLNILAARDNNHNLLLSKIYDCTVNKEYLKNYLCPNIPTGSIIITQKQS